MLTRAAGGVPDDDPGPRLPVRPHLVVGVMLPALMAGARVALLVIASLR